MKMTDGIEVTINNRSDGTPMLVLRALTGVGRKILTRMDRRLEMVRLLALSTGKADIYNVCGSQGTVTPPETVELMIPLALGGIGLHRRSRKARRKATVITRGRKGE